MPSFATTSSSNNLVIRYLIWDREHTPDSILSNHLFLQEFIVIIRTDKQIRVNLFHGSGILTFQNVKGREKI